MVFGCISSSTQSGTHLWWSVLCINFQLKRIHPGNFQHTPMVNSLEFQRDYMLLGQHINNRNGPQLKYMVCKCRIYMNLCWKTQWDNPTRMHYIHHAQRYWLYISRLYYDMICKIRHRMRPHHINTACNQLTVPWRRAHYWICTRERIYPPILDSCHRRMYSYTYSIYVHTQIKNTNPCSHQILSLLMSNSSFHSASTHRPYNH